MEGHRSKAYSLARSGSPRQMVALADHMAKACGSSSQRARRGAFPWLSLGGKTLDEIDKEISHRVIEMAK